MTHARNGLVENIQVLLSNFINKAIVEFESKARAELPRQTSRQYQIIWLLAQGKEK